MELLGKASSKSACTGYSQTHCCVIVNITITWQLWWTWKRNKNSLRQVSRLQEWTVSPNIIKYFGMRNSSLNWLNSDFLYAIFVQTSMLATKLNSYPIPPPLYLPPKCYFVHSLLKERRERVKFVASPKEMLLSFSILQFLTNYDVTNRKQ